MRRPRRPRAWRGEISVRNLGTFYWFGRPTPVIVGVDFPPELARQYADPRSHPYVVERIAAAIGEASVYDTDAELPPQPVKAKIEEAIRARFGRPGLLQVNLSGIAVRALAPHVDAPLTATFPFPTDEKPAGPEGSTDLGPL